MHTTIGVFTVLIFDLIFDCIFQKNGMKNGTRNEVKNDQKTSIFQKWTSCLFLTHFHFSSIFHLQFFKLLKSVSALSVLFVVAPYGNHLILFTIHMIEQAKKLR